MKIFPVWKDFRGKKDLGAFSIGVVHKERTVAYIQAQPEHHKRVSFAEEYRKFLASHGMREE